MKSLIYGYSKTGKSFERYLNKNEKLNFDIYDANIPKFNKKYDLRNYDQILCSPGIPKKIFMEIKKINKNILTDIDIFFKEDTSIKIGITGTNRKSTTAYHLHQLFDSHSSSNLIGNIGNPVLDFINNDKKYSIIELSSFQLDKMRFNKLDFGILLNIEEDHLDYHGNLESYKSSKEKILSSKNNISAEMNPYKLFEWITKTKAKKIELKNLPFRFQEISDKIINDSKSTNFHSLSYALTQAKKIFSSEYILITCGDPKKEKYREIYLEGPEKIFIFGKHSNEINKCIINTNKQIFKSLEDIFDSLEIENKDCNILFSPGYPSGNDFSDFVERGEYFNFYTEKYLNANH